MTDSALPANAATPAPAWYPDPYGSGALRWWDGYQWGEQLAGQQIAAPTYAYVVPPRRPLAPGTPIYTVWIWIAATIPVLTGLLLLLLHPEPAFRSVPGTSNVIIPDPFALMGGPTYFVVMAVNWLLAAGIVVFSWLDYRELRRRGVERPFHWAWAFLTLVYPIGRSVIVRGVAGGRGLAVMWVAIAAYVVSLLFVVIWFLMLVSDILGSAAQSIPVGA